MNTLRRHFGSQSAVAQALGVSKQVVSAWNRNGIPLGRQYEIQFLTGGKLRAGGLTKPRGTVKNNNQPVSKLGSSLIDNRAEA